MLFRSDGDTALQAARQYRPDLIMVDLFLPGMHGTQLVKKIRTDGELHATRVALYTGTRIDAMLADFMSVHSVVHVIPKPAEPEELLRAVDNALKS